MNLKFIRRVNERERAIRLFFTVKKQIDVSFYASILTLTMDFVITLSK